MTVYVPDDYATIQGAIDASANYDTIIVRPGTYVENLIFSGKEIIVESESGPAVTTINGGNPSNPDFGSVVLFENGETRDTVLDGFTIANGTGTLSSTMVSHEGGGIYCQDGSSPSIIGCVVTSNVVDGHGGGIACVEGSSPFIADCTITLNTTGGAYSGGGIYCTDGSPDIVECVISENWGGTGGGVYVEYQNPDLSACTIVNNTTDTYGGGIFCKSGATGAQVAECLIASNTAGYGGGGIWTTVSDMTLVISNIIRDNTVVNSGAWGGGGICVFTSYTTIVNNMISGNYSPEGGGLSVGFSSYPIVTNNTISENSAVEGGGLWCYDSGPTIENTIFWHNTANSYPEIYRYGPYPTINFCNVEGGWPYGNNNIDADPLFADASGNDFHLTIGSPCRDAGTDTATALPDEDFEEDDRNTLAMVDIGADELWTHLYHVGDVTPGSTIEIKIIGYPNLPVLLAMGSGIEDPPLSTPYGELWLSLPLYASWPLGPMPANAIMVITPTVPVNWAPGDEHPFQALIGPLGNPSSQLTNLMVLEAQ